jgi:phosphatidate phosphatase APP1
MLQQGDGLQNGRNPIFYVSSSPWNLYPLLTDFFEFQSVPTGPLFLKDYGITPDQLLTSGHGKHKLAQIEKILSTYPELPFVLIGDSRQKDPEIYQEVARLYPGRIKAIYIRDVSNDKRDAEVKAIAAEVEQQFGTPMVFAADSFIAAEHAAAHGMVPLDKLLGIRSAMLADTTTTSALETLLEESDKL